MVEGYRNLGLFDKEEEFIKFEEIANKINMSTAVLLELFIHDLVSAYENESEEFKIPKEEGILQYYRYWKYLSTGE